MNYFPNSTEFINPAFSNYANYCEKLRTDSHFNEKNNKGDDI